MRRRKKGRNKERIKKIKEFQEQRVKENRIRKEKYAKWLSEQREKQEKETIAHPKQEKVESPQTTINTISPSLITPGLALFIKSLKEMSVIIDPKAIRESNVVFEEGTLKPVLEILKSIQKNKQTE